MTIFYFFVGVDFFKRKKKQFRKQNKTNAQLQNMHTELAQISGESGGAEALAVRALAVVQARPVGARA